MAFLDNTGPVIVLSDRIAAVLDHQDGCTCIAAVALTLGSLIAYAADKIGEPMTPADLELRARLAELFIQSVDARNTLPRES